MQIAQPEEQDDSNDSDIEIDSNTEETPAKTNDTTTTNACWNNQ